MTTKRIEHPTMAAMRDLINEVSKASGSPTISVARMLIGVIATIEPDAVKHDSTAHILAELSQTLDANEVLTREVTRLKIDVLDLQEANQALRNKMN